MITEIITFDIPDGMTRDEVAANYRRGVPVWRANPDLIRKNYRHDGQTRRAGGVYLWRSIGAARRARGAAWLERVRGTYGSEPLVQYFEPPWWQTTPSARRSSTVNQRSFEHAHQ
jgi:hypothetical protein